MEADLRNIIIGAGAITALVPASAIRISFFKRGAENAIRLWNVDGIRGYHMKGPDGLVNSRIQLDIRCKDPQNAEGAGDTKAHTVAGVLVDLLSGFHGVVGSTQFQKIEVEGPRTRSDTTDTGTYYLRQLDLLIWHRPAA